MNDFALENYACKAFGHPGACSEPASGIVREESQTSITVTDNSGKTRPIGNTGTCSLYFSSHGHSTDSEGNCTSYQEHNVQPDVLHDSLKLNGEKLYKTGAGVATDPGSGGQIDILNE